MHVTELIRKKREGLEFEPEELKNLVKGFLAGTVRDYQISAWLMAVYFKGLTPRETELLTELMWHSGSTLPRGHRNDYWIDKHSTGGVGDKTSLIMVPLVSCVCRRLLGRGQVKIPMVSGRALGHSGGTLDKLESVPGFRSALSLNESLNLLQKNGFFMMGQTDEIAPLDRILYALRDATSTVENLSLIVSSIMSKKLSENLDGIIFDVKFGSGAFTLSREDACALASALVNVSRRHHLDAVALISRMDEPLGSKVGNHLEIEECADFLRGNVREEGLAEVVLSLSSQMVSLASRRKIPVAEAYNECLRELEVRDVFDTFKRMFTAQGGDWDAFERNERRLRSELKTFSYPSPQTGYISGINARWMGVLLNELGGGRATKEEVIDSRVGMEFLKKVGDSIREGEEIVRVYYKNVVQQEMIESAMRNAVSISRETVEKSPWIVECLA